jgi:enamine deaminase RidA (YjgF/YER057c/UK114 family)
MAAQLEMSLDNLEAVLAAADMTLANVVRLNVYTTDFDEFVKRCARGVACDADLEAWRLCRRAV